MTCLYSAPFLSLILLLGFWLSHPLLAQSQDDIQETLRFAGYTWNLKHREEPVGPGPNYFSARQEDVYTDEEGALHLRLQQRDGRWWSAEVSSVFAVGYGRYEFRVAGGADQLDPNVVLGLFTWDNETWATDANSEIDIELTRWCEPGAANLHYSVHPTRGVGRELHGERYQPVMVDLGDEGSTHVIDWRPDRVTCATYRGMEGPAEDRLVAAWTYDAGISPSRITGTEEEHTEPILVPRPSPTTGVRINLWLVDADGQGMADPPLDGQPVEVVITGFSYEPMLVASE